MDDKLKKIISKISNVVMYSRIGTDTYGNSSFEQQEDKMFAFAEQHGLSVVGAYREVASGALEPYSRPVLQGALEVSRKLKRCVLLVADVDRLTKSARLVYQLNDDKNIRFLSAKHGLHADYLHISMSAILVEENHRVQCERDSVPVVRVSDLGRRRFAENKKPMIVGLLEYGLTVEEVVQNMINIRMETLDKEWSVQLVEEILENG